MIRRVPHHLYYIIELAILLLGFFGVYLLSGNLPLQEKALAGVLGVYAIMGIFHHKLHHTLRSKIVVEYILVSVLIFACFLFLNVTKL